MPSKKELAGLNALKAIKKTTPKKVSGKASIAGEKSVSKALKISSQKKSKTVAMRLGGDDLSVLESLAIKLKHEGLQYSEANAVRLAIRLFTGTDDDIKRIANDIKAEDGRRTKI